MPIIVLDTRTVSRIAAGEVIERPASVVKELVENSLDAGSRQVSLEVQGGGVSLIRVTDDGAGIPADEVEMAFRRYATSKIGGAQDLETISTLGFRGEALPSIAAVAEVEIITCAAREQVGTYLGLKEGKVASRRSEGRSQGTTVTVRNLFRRIPARLKFLKSLATENSHIANVVSLYALAFPEVRFVLSLDGRVTLRTPGSGRLIDSITQIYGLEVAQNMLGIADRVGEKEAASTRVTGMAGSPKVARSSRAYLSFFINRRWVSSRLLARAVEEAYHGLLMEGKHPVAVLGLWLPSEEVDVNVHPAKMEVKFHKEHAVFATVQRAVRRALMELMPVPKLGEVVTTYKQPSEPIQASWLTPGGSRGSSSPLVAPGTPSLSLPVLRILGQLLNSYIVAEGPDGLYLIDQHAAHERIRFEEIKAQWLRQEIEVQGLLEPVTLEVSPKHEAVLKSAGDYLGQFGFAIEPFGDRTYLVRTVPALLHERDWKGMLGELLDSFACGDKAAWAEGIAISMACHSAVRAGQSLSDDEMRELVRQLEVTANPRTCPHGRPTMIHLSSGQMEKDFGRS